MEVSSVSGFYKAETANYPLMVGFYKAETAY